MCYYGRGLFWKFYEKSVWGVHKTAAWNFSKDIRGKDHSSLTETNKVTIWSILSMVMILLSGSDLRLRKWRYQNQRNFYIRLIEGIVLAESDSITFVLKVTEFPFVGIHSMNCRKMGGGVGDGRGVVRGVGLGRSAWKRWKTCESSVRMSWNIVWETGLLVDRENWRVHAISGQWLYCNFPHCKWVYVFKTQIR